MHNTNVYAYKHTVALGKGGKKKKKKKGGTDRMDHIAQSLRTPHMCRAGGQSIEKATCLTFSRFGASRRTAPPRRRLIRTAALQQKRKESVRIIP